MNNKIIAVLISLTFLISLVIITNYTTANSTVQTNQTEEGNITETVGDVKSEDTSVDDPVIYTSQTEAQPVSTEAVLKEVSANETLNPEEQETVTKCLSFLKTLGYDDSVDLSSGWVFNTEQNHIIANHPCMEGQLLMEGSTVNSYDTSALILTDDTTNKEICKNLTSYINAFVDVLDAHLYLYQGEDTDVYLLYDLTMRTASHISKEDLNSYLEEGYISEN